MTNEKVVVIGGGPAGMIACGRLSARGKKVVLVEKNGFLGKKLKITGKGRCNITNMADVEEMMENIPTNSRFLYSALYSFTNYDIIELLNSCGVPTKVERGGRVFPESDSAKDVVEALKRYALSGDVKLVKEKATEILINDGKTVGVKTESGIIDADSVIIATGGVSYPLTGSTGDGYRFAQSAGHKVVAPKASLVPLETKEKWTADLMGLPLKNVELTLFDGDKKLYTDFGEMLFTHFGVSGPIVLSASCHLKSAKNPRLTIDLKPALDFAQLDKRILRDLDEAGKKHLQNSLDALLPKALIPVIIKLVDISPHKEACNITKEERQALARVLKALPLTITKPRPIEEAIITSGGVKVSEINPSTMESKLTKGLYFAGEVIDVDAYTGGFNLQIAYSTGYLAGENA